METTPAAASHTRSPGGRGGYGGRHTSGRGRGRGGRGGRGRGRHGGGGRNSASRASNTRNKQSPPPKSKPCCIVCGSDDGKYKCPKCREPYCSVKCCREHKEKCPVLVAAAAAAANGNPDDADKNANTINGTAAAGSSSGETKDVSGKRKSKYLPSDALTADPLENAVKRRRMLDEDDSDSDDEGTGWRLTREMMDRIDNSQWLRNELADGGLRQLIGEIDAPDEAAAAQGSYHRRRYNHSRNRFAEMGKVKMSPRELALEKARRTNPNFGRFMDKLLLTAGILATPDGGSGGEIGEDGGTVSLEALLAGEEEVGHMTNVQLVPVARPRSQIVNETLKPAAAEEGNGGDGGISGDGDDGSSSGSEDSSSDDEDDDDNGESSSSDNE